MKVWFLRGVRDRMRIEWEVYTLCTVYDTCGQQNANRKQKHVMT